MQLDLKTLPNEPSLLHQLIGDLVDTLQKKDQRIEKLLAQLERLQRYQFGRKSEKQVLEMLLLKNAGLLDEVEELEKVPEEVSPRKVEEASPARKKKGHGRSPLPEHLPTERIEYPLEPEACHCEECGGSLEKIGEEITRQLDYLPASFHIREHVRVKYACKQCESGVITSEMPPQPIDKGLPGAGLLAQVLVAKYGDHLPLYRQEDIYARQGVELSRKTLCDWVKASADLLEPLYRAMKRDVLQSKVIGTDDTPVAVQDRTREGTRKGRIWVYVGDRDHENTLYDYTANRNKDGPAKFLEGYIGRLQADAYAGYDGLFVGGDIVEVGCMAHCRRGFVDAQSSDPLGAAVALTYIRQLYHVEKLARDLSAKERKELRHQQARPVLAGFKNWLLEQLTEVLPKSPLGEAIGYALRQWEALIRYLEDGDLAIDNNASERALRSIAVGRKNYLFFGSDAGGKRAAIIYSFIATCKRHHIDPFAYLHDVLGRLPSFNIQNLQALFPKNWKLTHEAIPSELPNA